eukprot:2946155-Amphidinium_carterae.1
MVVWCGPSVPVEQNIPADIHLPPGRSKCFVDLRRSTKLELHKQPVIPPPQQMERSGAKEN